MKALAVILVGVATGVPRGPLPSHSPSLRHTQSIPWSDLCPSESAVPRRSQVGMRRSHSGEPLQQPKKQGAKGMEKSSSVPLNMHSMIDDRRWQDLNVHDTSMQSHCVIKNSRCASSEMHVLMAAKMANCASTSNSCKQENAKSFYWWICASTSWYSCIACATRTASTSQLYGRAAWTFASTAPLLRGASTRGC
jgi:hypothetical protein